MSKRRSDILQQARVVGAAWRMSDQARSYLRVSSPYLYAMLEELSKITQDPPKGDTRGDTVQEQPPGP